MTLAWEFVQINMKGFRYEHDTIVDEAAILLNQDFVFGTTPIKDLVRQMEYTLWYFGLNMLGQSPLCFLNI
ncbi:hypothetical protein Ahy_A03g015431 isoform F [Arachis hypogaea]|uniref:Uncharacterized protein n=1 Tax=Arachis hypogaea TaxID=3818 RepID=A0A445E0H6_ARAHY|nr:hypothetical protein Ahy_A03g015431 isoform F [Arachis hypogaea]